MRAIVIYKDNTEYSRVVLEYLRDLNHQSGKTLEQVDPDTAAGTQFCTTYGIIEYPTILVLDDSGQMIKTWQGLPLPLISEVSYYAQ